MPNPVMERSVGDLSSRPSKREMPSPFVYRHGRRFLRDVPTYPLPVDLGELNRHVLRTLILVQIFGVPFCSTLNVPPKKVLELACGSAFWSSTCHQYLKQQGHANVSFTGVDIAPVAPDLKKHGVNWRFIQHDLRLPLPFEDEDFDLIFINNEFISTVEEVYFNPDASLARFLKPGGVVEVWKTDLHFRCLLPSPPIAVGTPDKVVEQAEKTATYIIGAGTPFAKAQNSYLRDCNPWIEKALGKIDSTATPCALIDFNFYSDPDVFGETGGRRLAIPFGTVRWENEDAGNKRNSIRDTGNGKRVATAPTVAKQRPPPTPDQLSLRRTALNVILGFIEGMEPLLIKESEKTQVEWDKWWAAMNVDLLEKDGVSNGECLEIGAWWARKKQRSWVQFSA